MRNYIIYKTENNDEILVKVNNYNDLIIIQKELIDKGYIIIRTAIKVFNNSDAVIEAVSPILEV